MNGVIRVLEILNLGAGVQSSMLALQSAEGELPKLDCAIFADTGWEPREVYDYVKWLKQACKLKFPIHRVHASNLKFDALKSKVRGKKTDGVRWASLPYFTLRVWLPTRADIRELTTFIADRKAKKKQTSKLAQILVQLKLGNEYEQCGMIKRQCTTEYKIQPIHRFIRTEILGLKPRQHWPKQPVVRQWFGISRDEWTRMRTPGKREQWKTNWYPLVDNHVTRQGCLEWFASHGLPTPPRSACVGCPYHSDTEWLAMKEDRPDQFLDACQFDEAIRDCGGMRGKCYLHRSCQPLRYVDFRSKHEKRGQGSLLTIVDSSPCDSGHCFV